MEGRRHSNKFAGGGDAKAAVGLDDFVVLDPYLLLMFGVIMVTGVPNGRLSLDDIESESSKI